MKTETRSAVLRKYGRAIAMWLAKFDTLDIARELKLPEALVAKWVANFRDVTRTEAA